MKSILRILFTMCFSIYFGACSSTPSQHTSETQEDKVIARVNDESSRPKWLDETKPFQIKDGNVISLGQTTIPGDNRVEAAYRIAENNAKGSIASAIETRLEAIFQNAEEGTSIDSTQARYIGAEASKVTTSAMRINNRYWEKVATTRDSGERITQFKVFTTVTMPEAEFKRAIIDAVRKREGKGGLSADFSKKVDAHWDQFVNADVSNELPKTEGADQ
jgi:hypothetical protein